MAGGLVSGQEPFQPDQADPVAETWRWQSLNGLGTDNRDIYIGEAEDIWIVKGNDRILRFNGTSMIPVPVLDEARLAIRGVGIGGPDELVLLSVDGTYHFNENQLTQLIPFPELNRYGYIVVEDSTKFWVLGEPGFIEYDQGEFRELPFPEVGIQDAMSVCIGKDEALYFVSSPAGDVYRCGLKNGKLTPPDTWERILSSEGRLFPEATLFCSSDGRIWYVNIHEHDGVQVYDPANGTWVAYDLRKVGGENFNTSVLESRDGKMWVVGRGSLQIFDGDNWRVYKSPQYPIPDSRPQLELDASGSVFLLERGAGVHLIDYEQRHYRSYNRLHFMAESRDGSLWFLHVDGAVVRHRPLEGVWEQFSPEVTGVEEPITLVVKQNGDVVCAGSTKEAAAFSVFDGDQWSARRFPGFAASFSYMGVKEISNGDVLLGCGQNLREYPNITGGLIRLFEENGQYDIEYIGPEIASFRSWCVAEDPARGTIYFSGRGLDQSDLKSRLLRLDEAFDWEWVDNIAVTPEGRVWVAIWGQGIYQYFEGEWEDYTDLDIFPRRNVSFVFAEDDEYPILATDKRIYRFDGNSWSPFMNPALSIYRGSGTIKQSGSGNLWVNSTHTDWYYRGLRSEAYPELKKSRFKTVQYIPDRSPPDTRIDPRTASLFTDEGVFIRWHGRDHHSKTPYRDLTYSYSLNGGPWSPFSAENHLSLYGLPGGSHEVQVRTRDTDFNIDPTPLVFSFQVILPIWDQSWFWWSLALVILTVLGLTIYIFTQRIRHILELERVKLHFFTNLSHELRTPLTLVKGPVEKLLDDSKLNTEQRSLMRSAQTNTSRLLNLIDQLLEFRRVEGGHLVSSPSQMDVVSVVRNVMESFEFVVREKRQRMFLRSPFHSCSYSLDEDLYFKILNNLIYNATKYSGEQGTIEISLDLEEIMDTRGNPGSNLVIKVSDDGRGIEPRLLPHVFEPFYRGSEKSGFMKQGIGIGLALVKEHVLFLKGTIDVESPRPNHTNGTAFTVVLPIGSPDVVKANQPLMQELMSPMEGEVITLPLEEEKDENLETDSRPHIHLVEDNLDVQQFLQWELSHEFRVTVSMDGVSAESTIREQVPDLVITDVMLPEMSGFDLCLSLKEDPVSSHIPVIILTAFKTQFHEQRGLEMGADDFISKPVSIKVLKLKIGNLLQARERLREGFRKEFGLIQPTSKVAEPERDFLERVDYIATEHISDEYFGVDQFADEMGMSRSSFYKKFKDLTGMSPAAFMKVKRMNEAARLILEGYGNITEIAFEVGFSEVSYFSRCFKEHFDCSPSRYKKEVGKHAEESPTLAGFFKGLKNGDRKLN